MLTGVNVDTPPTNLAWEGGSGSYFNISPDTISSSVLTVSYTIESISGSATNGVDYNVGSPLTGSVQIAAGASYASLGITPYDDATYEGDETVRITLTGVTGAAGYTVGPQNTDFITIKDNDAPGGTLPVVTFDSVQNGEEADENGSYRNGFFRLHRDGDASAELDVTYTVNAVTNQATPGSDYQTLSGTVKFLADEHFVDLDVKVLSNNLPELTEFVKITLTETTTDGYTLDGSSAARTRTLTAWGSKAFLEGSGLRGGGMESRKAWDACSTGQTRCGVEQGD